MCLQARKSNPRTKCRECTHKEHTDSSHLRKPSFQDSCPHSTQPFTQHSSKHSTRRSSQDSTRHVTGRSVSRHWRQRAQGSRRTKLARIWPQESPRTSHLRLDARFQTIANNAHETAATRSTHKHMQTNRPRPRTRDWTQNLKPLPTTRTRHLAQRVTQSRPQSWAPQPRLSEAQRIAAKKKSLSPWRKHAFLTPLLREATQKIPISFRVASRGLRWPLTH